MKHKHNFAKNLRTLRENEGLSVSRLAFNLGWKDYTLSKYESGIHEPRIQGVLDVAKHFKIDPGKLITGTVKGRVKK